MNIDFANKRPNKGKSLIAFPDEYVVFDLEATGYDPNYDEIIEMAAIRIKDNKIVDTIQTFVKPKHRVTQFITSFTGITNEMLEDAPTIKDVIPQFVDFFGDSILMGYNVNFDINCIYAHVDGGVRNDFIDVLRYARKLISKDNIENHKLITVANYLNVTVEKSHRSYYDCVTTFECYKGLLKLIDEQYSSRQDFINAFKPKSVPRNRHLLNANEIVAQTDEFNPDHPLYGKCCCFTGELERMLRKDAMQIVVNLGGTCSNSVTKKTNYLILGNFNYSNTKEEGKSSKLLKAEKYILDGLDLEIISENVFYDLLSIE